MNRKEKKRFEGTSFGYYDLPTAFIDARLSDGRLYNIVDRTEVKLKEDALVRLVVYRKDIPDEQREFYTEQRKDVLDPGTVIRFGVKGDFRTYKFEVTLEDVGYMFKKANKPSTFHCRRMVLSAVGESQSFLPEPMEIRTLNQAYFQMSQRVNPRAYSHTTNIYKTFFVKGMPLETIRF